MKLNTERSLEDVRDLLAAVQPLLTKPYSARGRTDPIDSSVTATFSKIDRDADLNHFYGFVTTAPLMVLELLTQLESELSLREVAR
jgi:hypothetical protein